MGKTGYFVALIAAVGIVAAIDALTPSMGPRWEAIYYVDMAENGIVGNSQLVAPFADRPGMPILSGAVARALGVPAETGFKIVGWIASVALLELVYGMSRALGAAGWKSYVPMVCVALTYTHVKYPQFLPTMVDVGAYPWMIGAFWALINRKQGLCLLLCCIGLLFKEFLAIPLFLLLVQKATEIWRAPERGNVGAFLGMLVGGGAAAILPRVLIHTVRGGPFLDPVGNTPAQLWWQLTSPLLDGGRIFNMAFGLAGYFLPVLLLMTPARLRRLVARLQAGDTGFSLATMGILYFAMNLFLCMYGGANVFVFVSYLVGLQVLSLALLLEQGIGPLEVAYVLLVLLWYNKIFLPVPLPGATGFESVDFYGAWGSRVTPAGMVRAFLLAAFVLGTPIIRQVGAGLLGGKQITGAN